MKLQTHNNKLVTNVDDAETQNFGIGDPSVVIDILRNRLYQHKVQTLVQEYICNARDAMRELGKGNAFEVTAPTRLEPVFKVRDFGPGIGPDRMQRVFILYGASTKRGSNNQTGGFGIGAKSAWSYTDSFTITTFIDGVKRAYVAHTGVNNNGRLDLVSTTETDEANGTEIQIAVKHMDIDQFVRAINRAVYFWDEKPTLHAMSTTETVKGLRLGDIEIVDHKIMPDYVGLATSYYSPTGMIAVIDGIAYPIPDDLKNKVKKMDKLSELVNKSVIFHIPTGVVEVSATRESIADSELSIAALEKLATKAAFKVKSHITDGFGKVTSTEEFFKTYFDLRQNFQVEDYAKHGDYNIKSEAIHSDLFKKVNITRVTNLGNRRRKVEAIRRIELRQDWDIKIPLNDAKHIFFLGKTDEKISNQNRRVKEYLDSNNISTIYLLEPLADDAVTMNQIATDLGATNLLSLSYTPLERKPRGIKAIVDRDKDEFCLRRLTGWNKVSYTTLTKNKAQWLYLPMNDKTYTDDQLIIISKYFEDAGKGEICKLGSKAVDIVDGDSNFTSLLDLLADYTPSKAEIGQAKRWDAKHTEAMNLISELKSIEDSELSDMAKEYKTFLALGGKLPDFVYNLVIATDEYKQFLKKDSKLEKVLKKYPLVSFLDNHNIPKDEVTFYLNAKYNSDNL